MLRVLRMRASSGVEYKMADFVAIDSLCFICGQPIYIYFEISHNTVNTRVLLGTYMYMQFILGPIQLVTINRLYLELCLWLIKGAACNYSY